MTATVPAAWPRIHPGQGNLLPPTGRINAGTAWSCWCKLLTDGAGFDARIHEPVSTHSHTLEAVVERVGPAFFQVVGMRVLQGREFTWSDVESSEPNPYRELPGGYNPYLRRGGS